MQLRSMVLVGIAIAALAGCGLKGPLYMPGEKGEGAPSAAADADKNRRPRPAPQVQKEQQVSPKTDSDAPITPVDPDRPDIEPSSGTR